MKKAILLFILLALAGVGGLWYWHSAARPTAIFRTVAVAHGDLRAMINATGTVEPEEVVDIGAQVAGQIKSFGRDPRDSKRPIDYGSPVEEGTVLAQIDDSLYRALVDQAKANLARAQADVLQFEAKNTQAVQDFERARTLLPRGAIAREEYDASQAASETARANVSVGNAAVGQAKAALRQAEINLGYCTIKSPVKGVIIDRRVNIGQTVVASLNAPSLFLIAKDLKRMQVWASVNEADVGSVHSGQAVRFTVDTFPGEFFDGVVAPDQPRLNASMTQNVVTYTVVVATDNSTAKLVPYLTANLQFEVSRRPNVLLVPNAALRWRPAAQQVAADVRDEFLRSLQGQGGTQDNQPSPPPAREAHRSAVWIADHGFVRPVPVRLGVSDGVRTELVDGDVQEGDLIVLGESSPEDAGGTSNPFAPQLFGGKK